jgi:ribosome maturation factor RimP
MESNTLKEIVEGFFVSEGLTDCFWVSERIAGNKIEIFIDSDDGVSFDLCRKVSRVIEAVIDESKEFGEKYTLDVSSSGVGSPLIMPRQYIKNIGRQIEVNHNDTKTKGVLKTANEDRIEVEYEETFKEGKKKRKVTVVKEIDYSDIDKARIKISFKK